ncbi:hypothetical protein A8C56_08000 [Niabella ginsenosidivorans]|uniref:Uncharacterized protein n=1 Tax=Niabella ginsenosidivorans TaxID=1176587 RepID=A0A1A9I2M4_9BACT|nr:right-handed parallel beta-helix repeat-containing protein [Niabella ginsenosidivorans]ANH80932.1 hypothetical protein A8C56_08000 [Niabella ginsenosidivorans]
MKKGLLYFFLICSSSTYAQFLYKNINQETKSNYTSNASKINSLKSTTFKTAVDLTKYLPPNYSKSGNVDYTSYIQKGLDENRKVIMPNFPILINAKGIKLKSNSSILFQTNSQINLKPTNLAQYGVIWIDNIENVDIYYPKLIGDKYNHLSSKGQWGMGLFITSSNNINIYNPIISKMWGDAIYIGQQQNKISTNITISNAFLDDNRRNGISIVSGNGIYVKNCFISNTNGVSPSGGIDIEPNANNNELKNIELTNITTYNNGSRGILVALDYLNGVNKKAISIDINNHKDYYSPTGLEIYSDRGNGNKLPNQNSGYISISKTEYYYNKKAGFLSGVSKKNNIELRVSNINSNKQFISSAITNSLSKDFKSGKEIRIK